MSLDNSNKYLDALIECLDELSSEEEGDKDEQPDPGISNREISE